MLAKRLNGLEQLERKDLFAGLIGGSADLPLQALDPPFDDLWITLIGSGPTANIVYDDISIGLAANIILDAPIDPIRGLGVDAPAVVD